MSPEKLKNVDVVYFLKEGVLSEEIRYSLRTLKNLPHRQVWVYGQKPSWMKNVNHVWVLQTGTKWQNTSAMIREVTKNPGISEKFIIMNDDFFVLKPVEKLDYRYQGTLIDRANECTLKPSPWGFKREGLSRYGNLLKETDAWLLAHGYKNRNFELHLPMVFEKKKMQASLDAFPNGGWAARRSLYGNMWKIKAREVGADCKVYSLTGFPAKGIEEFVSTTDGTFRRGNVGVYIRNHFKDKSDYEL